MLKVNLGQQAAEGKPRPGKPAAAPHGVRPARRVAIVAAYAKMGGVEALASDGAGSWLEFLLVPLADDVGGPVGIVISANLGAGQIKRVVRASWVGAPMAALTELIGLVAAALPRGWNGSFGHDPFVLQVGAEYQHRVRPFSGYFGPGYVL